jgi:peroxiredoxin
MLLACWCVAQQGPTRVDRKTFVGKPALDFSVTDLDGNPLLLSSLKGKVVYIEFWTSYHTECVERMKEIQRLFEATDRNHLVILPVTAESNLIAQDFLRAHQMTVPAYTDSSGAAHATYLVHAMPLSVVVDKSGTVVEYVQPEGDFASVLQALRKAGIVVKGSSNKT